MSESPGGTEIANGLVSFSEVEKKGDQVGFEKVCVKGWGVWSGWKVVMMCSFTFGEAVWE